MLFPEMKMSTVTGNDGQNIYWEWMDQELRKLLSNIIPKGEEMWDVQERDGCWVAGTGQGYKP